MSGNRGVIAFRTVFRAVVVIGAKRDGWGGKRALYAEWCLGELMGNSMDDGQNDDDSLGGYGYECRT